MLVIKLQNSNAPKTFITQFSAEGCFNKTGDVFQIFLSSCQDETFFANFELHDDTDQPTFKELADLLSEIILNNFGFFLMSVNPRVASLTEAPTPCKSMGAILRHKIGDGGVWCAKFTVAEMEQYDQPGRLTGVMLFPQILSDTMDKFYVMQIQ